MQTTIRGIQEAQRANLKWINALEPKNNMGKMVKVGTSLAHQESVVVTHVDMGALRASHRMDLSNPLRGIISIDPASRNPKSNVRPADYGLIEHARGGEHAFYHRVENEKGSRIADHMVDEFMRGLPR